MLKPIPVADFGGVDSRSNPLALPQNRALLCKNWVPMPDGHLQLRRSYAAVTQNTVVAGAVHSIQAFRDLSSGTRYVVFWQGTTPKLLNVATGAVTSPTVKGTAIASSSPFSYALCGNCLHAYNGTDKKFFDGTYWRDVGLPALSDVISGATLAAITVAVGAGDANGIAASAIGGSQPGYQFYASIYNRATGHVGNRTAIGARVVPGVASDINITVLPDLSGQDTEWDLLIGRTGDGAEVPYAVQDSSGNWIYAANAAASITITQKDIDGESELPTLNDQPPAFIGAARVGDRITGIVSKSPYVHRSFSETDAAQGSFVGRPEQSFDPSAVETFPSGEDMTGIFGVAYDTWVGSLTDIAFLIDQQGNLGWDGPYSIGVAGQQALTFTAYGPFWVTGDKQLATKDAGGVNAISDEYEAALLAKIGDSYLSAVEVRYIVDVAKQIDHLMIKARDANGNPFRIIHDFKKRDAQSPYGQGYEDVYSGPLATDYSTARVRDVNGRPKIWAGASDGKLYELNSGVTEPGGAGYTADLATLINAGLERPAVKEIEWVGDSALEIYLGDTLAAIADVTKLTKVKGASDGAEVVPGEDGNPRYRVGLPTPETSTRYLWLRLAAHPADGNLDLSSPPHFPLETYGRIWLLTPMLGTARGVR